MSYQFTFHAIQRCKDRALAYDRARKLFESAKRVRLRNRDRRFYKLLKYGESELKTEYWYSKGYVFVCERKDRKFSMVLTLFKANKEDLIFYEKNKR